MKAKDKPISTKNRLMSDLELVFKVAMEAGNFTAALKAKELIAKQLDKDLESKKSIKELSDEEIQHLIDHMENSKEI
jgi:hypothetical protein